MKEADTKRHGPPPKFVSNRFALQMIPAEAVSRMLVANVAKAVRQERVTVSLPPNHPDCATLQCDNRTTHRAK